MGSSDHIVLVLKILSLYPAIQNKTDASVAASKDRATACMIYLILHNWGSEVNVGLTF